MPKGKTKADSYRYERRGEAAQKEDPFIPEGGASPEPSYSPSPAGRSR